MGVNLEIDPTPLGKEVKSMNEKVQQLRDAVLGRSDREVEVGPNGEVRERTAETPEDPEKPMATKLAARTFGK